MPRNTGNLAPHAVTPSARGFVSNFKALQVVKEKIAVIHIFALFAARKITVRVNAQNNRHESFLVENQYFAPKFIGYPVPPSQIGARLVNSA